MKDISRQLERFFSYRILGTMLCCLPFVFLLFSETLISQGDLTLFLNPSQGFFNSSLTWSDYNLGKDNSQSLWQAFPLYIISITLINGMGVDPGVFQFILFSSLLVVGFQSMWMLLKYLFDLSNNFLLFVSSISYVFNTYSITIINSSFLVLIPFVLLPAQILMFLKYINTGKMRYCIIFSLIFSLSAGVNLVYNFIAIVAFLYFLAIANFLNQRLAIRITLWRLFHLTTLSSLLILWWLLVFMISNFSHIENANHVLSSESFYNLESSPLNVIRNLGYWAFFSGDENGRFYPSADLFENNYFFILGSLLFLIISVSTLLLRKSKNSYLVFSLSIFLVLLIFAFIGGTNTTWFTHSFISYLFESVPFFGIFRNTYKWTSLIILVKVFTIYYGLSLMTRGNSVYYRTFFGLVILIFSLYFAISFNLFSDKKIIDKPPEYWSIAADYINYNIDTESRILQLPDQYFDVYLWNDNKNYYSGNLGRTLFKPPVIYGTCDGCGSYLSEQALKKLYGNIDDDNISNVFPFLGISTILFRNDFIDDRLYSLSLNLDSDAYKTTEFDKLLLYENVNNEPLFGEVYLPDMFVLTKNYIENPYVLNGVQGAAPVLIRDADFINIDDIHHSVSHVENIFSDDTLTFSDSRSSYIFESSLDVLQDSRYEVIDNFYDALPFSSWNTTLTSNDSDLDFSAGKAVVTANGSDEITFSLDIDKNSSLFNLVNLDTSFFDGRKAIDCSGSNNSGSINTVSYIDKTSLLLSSLHSNSCITSRSINLDFGSAKYVGINFTFSAKKDNKVRVCLWDGRSCLLDSEFISEGNLQEKTLLSKLPKNVKSLNLYIYSPSSEDLNEVTYSNINVFSSSVDFRDSYLLESITSQTEIVSDLKYEKVNKTKYKVSINNVKYSFPVVLNVSNHPLWKIKNYKYENKFIANDYANGWYLDPYDFCVGQAETNGQIVITVREDDNPVLASDLRDGCTLNDDGSYDISMVIEFFPQRWFYLGLLISGTTFLGMVGYLVYSWLRRRKGQQ